VIDRTALRPGARSSPITYTLIAINLLLFFAGQADVEMRQRLVLDFAQHPALVADGDWYRVLTAMFLHGSITHILFNSYALWLFGSVIERRFGSSSFVALYLGAGIAGGAAYQISGRMQFAVGASGAIFGLFGALLSSTYRQRHTPAGPCSRSSPCCSPSTWPCPWWYPTSPGRPISAGWPPACSSPQPGSASRCPAPGPGPDVSPRH
jgi:hypothetical protein